MNLRKREISIKRAVSEVRGKPILGPVKTKKSKRTIEIPKIAADALREHRKAMLAAGTPGPQVFCDTKGGLLRDRNIDRRSFKPILKKRLGCRTFVSMIFVMDTRLLVYARKFRRRR